MVKSLSFVQRVKQLLNLADGSRASDKVFSDIRQTAKLITGEYFDFKEPWRLKGDKIISRAVNQCIREIPALLLSSNSKLMVE